MACHIPGTNDLLLRAKDVFERTFGGTPERAAYAPGRVNLIGEHTDYNDGFVLPMALQMETLIVGRRTRNCQCRVQTTANVGESNYVEFPVSSKDSKPSRSNVKWANYVIGVVAFYHGEVHPFDAVIVSSVPLGGGVSSSASLQVAVYTFLDQLNSSNEPSVISSPELVFFYMTHPSEKSTCYNNPDAVEPMVTLEDKAHRCMEAEHQYIGLMDGIMDQFIAFTAKKDHALLLDCRSLSCKNILLSDESVTVLLTNSNVSHELIHTEYPIRTQQCKEAATILGVESLRDVKIELLKARKEQLGTILYRRAHHVVTEIHRACQAADALEKCDLGTFGKLMVESHNSLRNDYEVSCAELDVLVEAALEVDGVYGSRMTGGGFGGCTVTLVKTSAVDEVLQHIQAKYSQRATFYICKPSEGARGVAVK